MKRFFHKPDVDAYCLAMGWSGVKAIDSIDTRIPNWPENADWLPKDWRIAYRWCGSRDLKIYIPPNQEEGFIYEASDVRKYLAGTKTTLSPFESSMSQALISELVGNNNARKSDDMKKKTSKVVHEEGHIEVGIEDYVDNGMLSVTRVRTSNESVTTGALCQEGVDKSEADDAIEQAYLLCGVLRNRGFPVTAEVMLVWCREAQLAGRVADHLTGIYYRLPGTTEGKRPCYQRATISKHGIITCSGLYIFCTENRWKIGSLSTGGCFAFNTDVGQTDPSRLSTPWPY